jgi:hypothetical protein
MTTVDNDLLIATLDRLKLTAIRDQLDSLLDEATRSKMTLREALVPIPMKPPLCSEMIAPPDSGMISPP